ncbi:Gag-pol polyprotein-like protein [Hibiscus syriacus]|uniref:Gag-pol polyprotein-like protein n=1 Tax=Hibiscus syriacus TaxID=106335 RepID=A0A6A2X270_HIBSY|nr:Gag-pol polyprotein-like protein [Hibiscus syriacus]
MSMTGIAFVDASDVEEVVDRHPIVSDPPPPHLEFHDGNSHSDQRFSSTVSSKNPSSERSASTNHIVDGSATAASHFLQSCWLCDRRLASDEQGQKGREECNCICASDRIMYLLPHQAARCALTIATAASLDARFFKPSSKLNEIYFTRTAVIVLNDSAQKYILNDSEPLSNNMSHSELIHTEPLNHSTLNHSEVRVPVGKNCFTLIIFNIPESFHYQAFWRKKLSGPNPAENKSKMDDDSQEEDPIVGVVDEDKLLTIRDSLVDWGVEKNASTKWKYGRNSFSAVAIGLGYRAKGSLRLRGVIPRSEFEPCFSPESIWEEPYSMEMVGASPLSTMGELIAVSTQREKVHDKARAVLYDSLADGGAWCSLAKKVDEDLRFEKVDCREYVVPELECSAAFEVLAHNVLEGCVAFDRNVHNKSILCIEGPKTKASDVSIGGGCAVNAHDVPNLPKEGLSKKGIVPCMDVVVHEKSGAEEDNRKSYEPARVSILELLVDVYLAARYGQGLGLLGGGWASGLVCVLVEQQGMGDGESNCMWDAGALGCWGILTWYGICHLHGQEVTALDNGSFVDSLKSATRILVGSALAPAPVADSTFRPLRTQAARSATYYNRKNGHLR